MKLNLLVIFWYLIRDSEEILMEISQTLQLTRLRALASQTDGDAMRMAIC